MKLAHSLPLSCLLLLGCVAELEEIRDEPTTPPAATHEEMALQTSSRDLRVKVDKADGQGCPPDSYELDERQEPDGTLVYSIQFFEYWLSGEESRYSTKACNIFLRVTAKSGTSFALSKVFFNGTVMLEEGQKASIFTEFKTLSNPEVVRNVKEILGPHGIDPSSPETRQWDVAETPTPVWSRCGADETIRLTTSLVLENPRGTPGLLGMQQAAGELARSRKDPRRPSLRFSWRTKKCSP